MATIILLVLAVSLDALSFGVSQGINKNKISFFKTLFITVLSTILFGTSLYLSSIIGRYLNDKVCYFINSLALFILGIIYILKSLKHKDENIKTKPLNYVYCFFTTLTISLDAIITAFLTGYTINNLNFCIFLYFLITFIFIFVSNRIVLTLVKKISLNIEWISGLLFIILGILKFLEVFN